MGDDISLKVHEDMDIVGVVAQVILAMRTVQWEVMLFRIWPIMFKY
jgi:hypothetical protein